MKHVEAYLSARDERESSFLPCWEPVRLVQAWLCVGEPDNAVLTSDDVR